MVDMYLGAADRERVLLVGLSALGSDKAYEDWVRTQPSCISGTFQEYIDGEGRSEAAHVRRSYSSGTAYKPPYGAIPLRPDEHKGQHEGEESFFMAYYPGIDRVEAMQIAERKLADSRRAWSLYRLEGIAGVGQYTPVNYQEVENWARDVFDDRPSFEYFMRWLRDEQKTH